MIERTYISRILANSEAFTETEFLLHADYFADTSCQKIFQSAKRLLNASQEINYYSVLQDLKEHQQPMKAVDILEYSETKETTAIASSALAYQVISEYKSREIGIIGNLLTKGKIAPEIAREAIAEIEEIGKIEEESSQDQLVNDSIKRIYERVERKRKGERLQGELLTGIHNLDLMSVYQTGEYIIEAARPGMGKSSFARTKAIAFARQGIPVLMFTLEMSPQKITELFICSEGEINSQDVRRGELSDTELKRYARTAATFSQLPIDIEMLSDISELRGKVKSWRRRNPAAECVVIVDYIGQIEDRTHKGPNKNQKIERISKVLQSICKRDRGICMIALSQLSRAVESRGGDRRPMLSDIRDSGAIEQDADAVVFIYRPEYYDFVTDDEGNSTQGLAEFIVSKNRNGESGTVKAQFIGKYGKFTNWQTGAYALGSASPSLGNQVVIPGTSPKITAANQDGEVPF